MTESKSDAAARALVTLLDFEAITTPLETSVLARLMRGEPSGVEEPEGARPPPAELSWVSMTVQRPSEPGTYVVRIVWKTASLQLMRLAGEPSGVHWTQVTHWYGPLPLPVV